MVIFCSNSFLEALFLFVSTSLGRFLSWSVLKFLAKNSFKVVPLSLS